MTTTLAELRTIAESAALAPSVHNTQPWRITVAGSSLEVRADRTRQLGYLDPTGRQLHVSCGAAVEFAYVAARAVGFECTVEMLPEPADPDLLARLNVSGHLPPDDDERRLAAAIATRYTDRGPYADRTAPPEALDAVRRAATQRGAWVQEFRRPGDRGALITILADAERAESTDCGYAAELARWTRRQDDEGLPDSAIQNRWPADRVSDVPLRDFTGHNVHPAPGDSPDREPPHVERDVLLLLGTELDDRASWLDAGRALGRMLLTVAAAGLSAQPLGQAIDLPGGRERLRRELGLVGYPQFVLRVGYGSDRPRARRRPTG